jgi:hypothetical protein
MQSRTRRRPGGPRQADAWKWRRLERALRAAGWSRREALVEIAREKERERGRA